MGQTEQDLYIGSWNLEGSTQGYFECPRGAVASSCDSDSDSMQVPSRRSDDTLCLARSKKDGHVYLMPEHGGDWGEWLRECRPVRVEYHNTTDPGKSRNGRKRWRQQARRRGTGAGRRG